jgi:hypothetical protein
MKTFAKIIQKNATMQTCLQSCMHYAERRADPRADARAVFRVEKWQRCRNGLQK